MPHRTQGWLLTAATALLPLLGGCPGPDPQADPLVTISSARTTLIRSTVDPQPLTRAHALEAVTQVLPIAEAGPLLHRGLGDKNPAVRFAATMGIGDCRYAPARATLLKMAGDKSLEPDRRVYCAIIYALHMLGNDTHAPDLAALLGDREKEVRAQAALAMGKMGEVSAVGPLKTLLSDEREALVELQVVESLALLGDEGSLLRLEAYVKRPFLDERLVAVGAMARTGSQRWLAVLQEVLDRPGQPQVRAAAAGALGRLGRVDPEGCRLCLRALTQAQAMLEAAQTHAEPKPEEVDSLRQIAALALGWMGDRSASGALEPLLRDSSGAVRVAAALSILRLAGAAGEAGR